MPWIAGAIGPDYSDLSYIRAPSVDLEPELLPSVLSLITHQVDRRI
jgi:hypothetical protein